MGMCLALHSVSDQNIQKIIATPDLIWQLVAPGDDELAQEFLAKLNKRGFFSRLFGKRAPVKAMDTSVLEFIEGENVDNDLDKAWHGIHYCLNQTEADAQPPMDFITHGGELAGDTDVGYGPARLIRSQSVKEINRIVSTVTREQLYTNYQPEKMHVLDIYPAIWKRDGDEAFDYIAEYFEVLKTFIAHCDRYNLGMAVYLC